MKLVSLVPVLVVLAATSLGCEKKVPEDIVQKALSGSLRHMPNTASAMCGGSAKGLTNVTVSITKRGEKNTGTAHVKGKPFLGKDAADSCEGDVEYAFSYKTKTYGTKKKKRTETTWFLDKIKLVDVQTKGVKFEGGSEESNDPDADDDEE